MAVSEGMSEDLLICLFSHIFFKCQKSIIDNMTLLENRCMQTLRPT